ncbi:hypothetical protein ETR_09758 [Erwinia tracheiphila PSU-1]|nr:hypothetical protein ETR_09758 [Erwinia tracheiphila PSU-1]
MQREKVLKQVLNVPEQNGLASSFTMMADALACQKADLQRH